MNLISLKVDMGSYQGAVRQEKNLFYDGFAKINVKRQKYHIFDEKNYCYNFEEDIFAGIIGYISNLEEVRNKHSIRGNNDCDILNKLYQIRGEQVVWDLDGVFTIIVYERKKKYVLVYRDKYGSNIPLYYANVEDKIVVSNSIKEVLCLFPKRREMDIAAAKEFLYSEYHIVPNSSTLVKGIKKLMPWQFLFVDGSNNNVLAKKRKDIKERRQACHKGYDLIPAIKKSIEKKYREMRKKNLSCTLSSGFDSNLVLHFLSHMGKGPIRVYTIGGKEKNEIPGAKQITNQYKNVVHECHYVPEESLEYFPHIVWITEGYTSQKGIFMQYTLSKKMAEHQTEFAFLGDGADQILDQYRLAKTEYLKYVVNNFFSIEFKNKVKSFLNLFLPQKRRIAMRKEDKAYTKDELKLLKDNGKKSKPYQFDESLHYILMKNGIFMNHFGIQGVYPFLDQKIEAISKSLWKLNKSKAYYKKEVCKTVRPKIAQVLTKIGGDTDVEYLFQNKHKTIRKLLEEDIMTRIVSKEIAEKIAQNPENYPAIALRLIVIHTFYLMFINSTFGIGF